MSQFDSSPSMSVMVGADALALTSSKLRKMHYKCAIRVPEQ